MIASRISDMRCEVIRRVGSWSMTTYMRGRLCSCKGAQSKAIFPSSAFPRPKMVCRYYLGFLTAAFHTFFIVPSAAGSEPYCNRTFYGVPNYLACNTLLFGKGPSHSGGIASLDNVDHGFLLPYFGRKSQFTDWQWRHRVLLPEVWRSRRLASSASNSGTDRLS